MLDMGFIHDVRRIIKALPAKRQTLFFSATLPPDIQQLAATILTDPARVEVTPPSTTVEKIDQSLYFVERGEKRALLVHVLGNRSITRVLVFTRTKHIANRLAEHLGAAGITAEAIHGNKSQSARERALANFKSGTTRVLVATDIAARGIDIDGISHVINFELPNVPETYVHRIGRTARAGADGTALSFCDQEERAYLRDIEKTIRRRIPVIAEHPYRSAVPMSAVASEGPSQRPAPRPHRPQQARNRQHRSGGRPMTGSAGASASRSSS
jgi:ATP-dependent RNA helicase RhlE